MPKDFDDIRVTVRWEEDDFPAYVLLHRHMRGLLASSASGGDGGVAAMLPGFFRIFGAPILSVVALALWWGWWSADPPPPDLDARLATVFVAVWLANALTLWLVRWSSRRAEAAELRQWFAGVVGTEHEVRFDAAGFQVQTHNYSARCQWSEAPAECRVWANHLAVLHPRLPILVPVRCLETPVREVQARIKLWARQAAE